MEILQRHSGLFVKNNTWSLMAFRVYWAHSDVFLVYSMWKGTCWRWESTISSRPSRDFWKNGIRHLKAMHNHLGAPCTLKVWKRNAFFMAETQLPVFWQKSTRWCYQGWKKQNESLSFWQLHELTCSHFCIVLSLEMILSRTCTRKYLFLSETHLSRYSSTCLRFRQPSMASDVFVGHFCH